MEGASTLAFQHTIASSALNGIVQQRCFPVDCAEPTVVNLCMLYRSFAEPRRRHGITSALPFLAACALLTGCATQNAAQVGDGKESGSRLPIPCVKVPLLTLPLTNRPCSNNLLEKLIPESDPGQGRNW
jgi:hypothetical protein